MLIHLNEAEQRLAQYLAKSRYLKSRQMGLTDAKIGPQDNWATDLEGIGAELAFCKSHNIYPSMDVGDLPDADAVLRDGRTVDVKATKYEHGHLLAVRWKGMNVDLFVLMVGEFPTYRCAGFMPSTELLQEKRLRDFGHGPTYAAAQNELKDF